MGFNFLREPPPPPPPFSKVGISAIRHNSHSMNILSCCIETLTIIYRPLKILVIPIFKQVLTGSLVLFFHIPKFMQR